MNASGSEIHGRLRMTEEDVLGGIRGMIPLLRWKWVYLTLVLAGTVFAGVSGQLVQNPGSLAPFLGVNAFLLSVLFFGPRWQARKVVRTLRLDEGDVSFRFDDEGMSMHAPGSTSSTAYHAIPGWREAETAFLITCGPNAASIVPKRAFADSDLERVRALLAANVKVAPLPGRKGVRRTFIVWVALIFAFLVVWHLFNEPVSRPYRREPAGEQR